jgi:5-methylcytosine-specific restriction endonuclease McrA
MSATGSAMGLWGLWTGGRAMIDGVAEEDPMKFTLGVYEASALGGAMAEDGEGLGAGPRIPRRVHDDAAAGADFRGSNFRLQRAAVLQEDPLCVFCGTAPSEVVDHLDPVKGFKDALNAGRMNPYQAQAIANSRANLAGACRACNLEKSAKMLGTQPGPTTYVAPNPADKVRAHEPIFPR